MIQRIQSLLLALVALGVALLFRFPIATYTAEPGIQQYTVQAELNLIPKSNPAMLAEIEAGSGTVNMDQSTAGMHTWPMTALITLVGVMALVSIFLYRNRVLQMRVVALAFLLDVIYVGLLFLWMIDRFGKTFSQFADSMLCGAQHTVYSAGTWIPVATGILLLLAQRAIRRDEMKVRAADRLR